MKKVLRVRIIAWSIVSVIILSILVSGVSWVMLRGTDSDTNMGIFKFGFIDRFLINSEDLGDYSSGNTEFPAEDIKSLDINWDAGEVVFAKSPNENIIISEKNGSSDNRMKWKLENGRLIVRSGTVKFGFFFSAHNSKQLVVNIPEKIRLDSISINTASASITADCLSASDINITTNSGGIQVDGLDAKNSHVENVSGSTVLNCMDINELHTENVSGSTEISGGCRKLHMESVSGGMAFELSENTETVDTETVSGETKIALTDVNKGFTVDYESVSGAFLTKLNGDYKGKTFVYGDGNADVSCESVSGDIILDSSKK